MTLLPARESFIECALKHTLAPPNESDNSKRLKQLVVLRFTPVGASAQYYCNDDDWNAFLHLAMKNSQNRHSFTIHGIVFSLFELFEDFNLRLLMSVYAREFDARTLARSTFSTTLTKPKSIHGFLQALLLDKLIWASLTRADDADLRPPQQPYFETPVNLPERANNVFELYTKWDVTVSTFVRNWSLTEETAMVEANGDGGDEEQPAEVLSSLYRGLLETATKLHIVKVEQTFCMAALGLMGLMLRAKYQHGHTFNGTDPVSGTETASTQKSQVGDSAVMNGDSDKSIPEYFTIGALLKKHDKEIPESIAKLEDGALLRPLYILAAVSPICMLSAHHVSINSNTRITLQMLCQGNVLQCVAQPFLLPDGRRRHIEHDILSIILDMAIKGRRVFQPKMKAAILGWKARGILDETNACTFSDESPKANLMDWSTEYKNIDQVKRFWIENLSKEILKVKTRHIADISIDMTSIGVEWATYLHASSTAKDGPYTNSGDNAGRGVIDDRNDITEQPKRKREVESNPQIPKSKRRSRSANDLVPLPIKPVYKLPSVWDTKKCNESGRKNIPVAFGGPFKNKDRRDIAHLNLTHFNGDNADSRELFEKSWMVKDSVIPVTEATSLHRILAKINFQMLPEPAEHLGPVSFDGHKTIKTLRSHIWNALGSEGQRNLLSWTNVHVIPTSKPQTELNIFDSEEAVAFLGTMVDLTAQHQCEDQSAEPTKEDYVKPNILKRNWNLRHASLLEFILETSTSRRQETQREARTTLNQSLVMEGGPKTALCLNMNDIPINTDFTTIQVDDGLRFQTRNEPDYTYHTKVDRDDLARRWLTASNAGVWSEWHMSSAGYSTYMTPFCGETLVILPVDATSHPSMPGWEGEIKSEVILLRKGEELYLKPAQDYATITSRDTVCLNGNFYCDEQYVFSLIGLTFEHYIGASISTRKHPKSPLLLFKRFFALQESYKVLRSKQKAHSLSNPRSHLSPTPTMSILKAMPRPPSNRSTAALLIIIKHMDQLPPQLEEDSDVELWQDSQEFQADFKYVSAAVDRFIDEFKVDPILEEGGVGTVSQESLFSTMKDLENGFANLCQSLESRYPREKRGKSIRVLCSCGLHSKACT